MKKISLKGRFIQMILNVAIPIGMAYLISYLTINIWPVKIIVFLLFCMGGIVIFDVWLKEKFSVRDYSLKYRNNFAK